MRLPRLTLLLLAPAALCLVGPPRAAAQKARTPTFAVEGVAFLKKHCLACHGPKVKRADLVLHPYTDDRAVVKGRKVWQNVLQMVRSGEMPPRARPRPTVAEVEAFTGLVQGVFARADRSARLDPGRVTVRRLNRAEYNNTIRDLVGVDFNPADDFPSDDVGHGFDNIGEVLSLSPVLLERYLAAAESIVQRAILVDLPKPPVRRRAGLRLEPFNRREVRNRKGPPWRSVSTRGELSMPLKLPLPGDYVLRVQAHGQSPDGEPVRLALLADGKQLKTFDVTATARAPGLYEVKFTLPAGPHRLGVALVNPSPPHAVGAASRAAPAAAPVRLGSPDLPPPAVGAASRAAPAAAPVRLGSPDLPGARGEEGGAEPRTLVVRYLELVGPQDARPLSQRRLLACTPGKSQREQTREVLARFASRAYRRPATAEEVERLVTLAERARARGEKWEATIQLAMQAVLVSPRFLFRLELDDRPETPGPRPLDEYQLASRLSYFLWSSMPDDELFALAGKKALSANLDAQVKRMLADPKARALVDNFAMQWLQLRRLKSFAPDPRLFPSFNEQLRSAMLTETELFVSAVFREDRSILDLIDADFTFLNGPLARHYGIADTNGNRRGQRPVRREGEPIWGREFVRVKLADGQRGGLLTQASVLTVTSNPTRTSPVKRGRWVLEQVLGTPPPPPPPDVPELAENAKAVLSGSLRQRLEQHRANPACASCHARMDPLGFAFENYDAIGAFRSHDGKFPVDPAGTLPDGKSFKGPAELKTILRGKKDLFARNLTEKMLTYALGRGLEHYDRPAVKRIVTALTGNDYKFSTLVTEIARSVPFRMRRGKERAK
jgi:hypothetical protein